MLSLAVSPQSCTPGKPLAAGTGRARPATCETCGAPGGAAGVLLEEHLVGRDRSKFLCPLCHACLHLDVAGRKKAGRVIWLPELSQEQLNILCLATFVAKAKGGLYRKNGEAKAIIDCGTRLYKAWDRRAESVETFLGGSAVKSLMPRQSLSSPVHIASLLVRARRESNISHRDLAQRVQGLRLLPAPAAFQAYIEAVGRLAAKAYPLPSWTPRATQLAKEASAAASESTGHFDAESVPG